LAKEEEVVVMSHKSRSALERAMARTLDAFARRAAAGGGGGSEKSGSGDGVVVLSQSRAVVRLSGSDSAKLLQGLVTNDVDVLAKWEKDEERRKREEGKASTSGKKKSEMYAALLTPKGRIVTDVFLHATNKNEILIDSCRDAKDTLLTQIVRRKLRSDVSVEDASEELSVCVVPPSSHDVVDDDDGARVLLPADPRWIGLGRRGISRMNQTTAKKTDEDVDLDEKVYAHWRHANGVPEGSLELGDRFPAETRLTHLHAVSFTKGCYVGQEPTARAEFQGEVRKGIVPVVFDEDKEIKVNGTVISKKGGKEIGKVVASRGGGVGLALVRFAKVENVSEGVSIETVDDDGAEKEMKTFTECEFGTPNWWSHRWTSRD
jgi:folate-binding protein YgfZ